MSACGGGSSAKKASNPSATTAKATTTTVARAKAVESDCDLFTAADMQAGFGLAFATSSSEISSGCLYAIVPVAAEVTVSFAHASTSADPHYGQTYFRAISSKGGQPVGVPGAAQATYASTTNSFGQTQQTVAVLAKSGESFTLTLDGDGAPKNAQTQLVAVAAKGVQRLAA